jgi:mitochondrial fission protein ELM1
MPPLDVWTLFPAGNRASERQTTTLATAIVAELSGRAAFKITPKPVALDLVGNPLPVDAFGYTRPLGFDALAPIFGPPHGESQPPALVIGVEPEIAAVGLGLKAHHPNTPPYLHILNPNRPGLTHFAPTAFDALVLQPHEADMAGAITIRSPLALNDVRPQRSRAFEALATNVTGRRRSSDIAVLVGGSDPYVTFTGDMFSGLADDILAISRSLARQDPGARIIVLTSRRTGVEGKAILSNRCSTSDRIVIDPPDQTYADVLENSSRLLISGESFSMVSEGLQIGTPVLFYAYRGKLAQHPVVQHLHRMTDDYAIGPYQAPDHPWPTPRPFIDPTPQIAQTVIARTRLKDLFRL